MNIVSRIMNRLTVVYATLSPEGWQYRLLEMECKQGEVRIRNRKQQQNSTPAPEKTDDKTAKKKTGKTPAENKGHEKPAGNKAEHKPSQEKADNNPASKKKRKSPVILVLGGQGIVCKEYPKGDPAIGRITSRPEEFIFAREDTHAGQRLVFMRRQSYVEALAGCPVPEQTVIDVRIDPQGDAEREAIEAAKEFFSETLTLRQLTKPSRQNNTLFSLLTRRLLLPVLGICLCALVMNFFIRQNLQQKRDEQQFLLGRIRQDSAVRERQQGQQQQLENRLLGPPRYAYAHIGDRIASATPDGITLTALLIHPTEKKLQENKPLQSQANRVVIRGEAASSLPVTRFTENLQQLEIRRTVQLLSLTRDRNDRYQFEIDLQL